MDRDTSRDQFSKELLLKTFREETLTPYDYDLSQRVFSFTELLQPYALTKVEQFKCGFPCSMGKKVFFLLDNPWVKENPMPDDSAPGSKHLCTRCDRPFFTTQENYITEEGCIYHWGKIYAAQYTCCGRVPGSMGCTTCRVHVWSGVERGVNGPFSSFVTTRKSTYPDRNIYALDCEMCYTVAGLEVARVSVVGFDGVVVYDTFVRPAHSVVDFNTQFSGVAERDLQNAKSLKKVQKELCEFIRADTILIGHGLDNDLRALRMVHGTVLDTSLMFPHHKGMPFRRGLKELALSELGRHVQEGRGHSSCEDARTSLDLVKHKLLNMLP
ncbi:exonuclease GOR-like [Zophobas morio]|uniref:exonuclease GOR-like n=1 Tax=Zophobas morio TaxID=2755281 RepID=UPI0030828699